MLKEWLLYNIYKYSAGVPFLPLAFKIHQNKVLGYERESKGTQ